MASGIVEVREVQTAKDMPGARKLVVRINRNFFFSAGFKWRIPQLIR